MKERPIIFNAEMVRAIINNRKTQTRRMVKPQPIPFGEASPYAMATQREHIGKPWMPVGGVYQDRWPCPYGQPGDRLWVRETWGFQALRDGVFNTQDFIRWGGKVAYKADGGRVVEKWIPSIHMPRRASRITLEIIRVRVERLQDISEDDAKAEGAERGIYCEADDEGPALRSIDCDSDERLASHRDGFRFIWECINGPGSWDSNPFVWVIEFRKETKP